MPYAGELAALGTAACWVATAVSFEVAGRRVGSLTVNLLRLVMAVGLLALANLLRRGLPLPTDASAHAWLWLSVSGLVGFTFGDLCLFRAFVVLGSRLSTLLMALAPPFTVILGLLLLGEVLRPVDLAGMALTVGGVAWAVADRRPRRALVAPTAVDRRARVQGVLLGLGGALGQAGGLVLSKLGMGSYDPIAATHIRVIAGTAGYVALFFVLGWWPKVRPALADRRALGFTALGAFFGPVVGVSLSLIAVQLVQAGVAASLMATTPILILPVAAWRGDRVGLGGVLGALVAVGGVILLFL
ncbi:MAG TPA: DMT family transporter [Thermoanaerobaculia bacterium]|nr:DMT family transporter [Thermoanaerobaculia bacterium]